MTTTGPNEPRPPAVSNTTVAVIVYVLYFLTYFTGGITSIIGVIIAYVQASQTTDPVLASHYRFQIRTFWIGLLYVVVGSILAFVVIGFAILLWWFIWSLVRCVRGVLALNENRPIQNPASWMFG